MQEKKIKKNSSFSNKKLLMPIAPPKTLKNATSTTFVPHKAHLKGFVGM